METGLSKLKDTIVDYLYKFPDDLEKKEIADFLNVNAFGVYPYIMTHFPYHFPLDYKAKDIKVCFSEGNGKYVMFEGKKLFFPTTMSDDQIKENYISLLVEQDRRSPHCYSSRAKFIPGDDDVIADIGAAEGIWTLSVIERCKKAYLFECEERWTNALKLTFAPWSEKVVIVNKYVGGKDVDGQVTLDTFFADKEVDCIKADIEGAELSMLSGGAKTLSQKVTKVLLCAYHNQEDESGIKSLLVKYGFEDIETTDRYMLFMYQGTKIMPPYVRRALVLGFKRRTGKKLAGLVCGSRLLGDFFSDDTNVGILTSPVCFEQTEVLTHELGKNGVNFRKSFTADDLTSDTSLSRIVVVDDYTDSEILNDLHDQIATNAVFLSDAVNALHDRYFLFEPLKKILEEAGIKERTVILGWCGFYGLYGHREIEKAQITFPPATPKDLSSMYFDIAENSPRYIDEIFGGSSSTGKFVKIADGLRRTLDQPASSIATIHVVGESEIFGTGADDRYTLPSCLQALLNEKSMSFRVVNRGSPKNSSRYALVAEFVESLRANDLSPNDIFIISLKPSFHRVKWKEQKEVIKYVSGYMEKIGLNYLDLAPTLRNGHDKNIVYVNNENVNHRGNRFLASVIYFECLRKFIVGRD